MASSEIVNGLGYPFGKGWAPEPGSVFQVAPGVHWLNMPLPMRLARINLWLLEDGDGWTVVDTGLNLPASEDVWESVISGLFSDRPVTRVIVTHLHPDHAGMAGWLTRRFGCELWMSREEFLMCRNLAADTGNEAPQAALDFYRGAGLTDHELSDYRKKFGSFGRMLYPLPDSYRRLQDRQTLVINDLYWQVITGNGHSPEHACLYCPALKVLISGDQVIPRISSNISVWPTEPHGDPLGDWLKSCQKLIDLLPPDLLVLPSHQEPFRGLHTRLNQLIEGHTQGLEKLYALLETPKSSVECFSTLFKREVGSDLREAAVGEAIAHLNYLHQRRVITCETIAGVNYYRQDADAVLVDSPDPSFT